MVRVMTKFFMAVSCAGPGVRLAARTRRGRAFPARMGFVLHGAAPYPLIDTSQHGAVRRPLAGRDRTAHARGLVAARSVADRSHRKPSGHESAHGGVHDRLRRLTLRAAGMV